MGSEEGAVSLTSLGQSVWTVLRRSFLIDSVGDRKGEKNAQWGSLCGSCRGTEVSGSTNHNICKVSHGVLGK